MSPRAFVLRVLLAPMAAWSQPRGVDFYKELGYLLGRGLIQPRIALRGTLVTGVGAGGAAW